MLLQRIDPNNDYWVDRYRYEFLIKPNSSLFVTTTPDKYYFIGGTDYV